MLTLDLGNTRTKVCAWEGSDLGAQGEFARGEEARLLDFAASCGLARAALSTVAGPEYTGRVVDLLAGRAIACAVAPDCGLENRTATPETVGHDRLYAARGALAELHRSCLVCDLGTALTVDAVLAPGSEPGASGSDRGAFLGGAIAVGPELAARALHEHTAGLPRVSPEPGVPALGRDTLEALRSGCVVGVRGAARGLLEEIAVESGLTDAPVFVTGGGRSFLLEPEPFTGRVLYERPWLVHRGLLEAARRLLP